MGEPASKRADGKLEPSAAISRITHDRTSGVAMMLVDVTEVKVLDHYNLRLYFEDGTAGEIDVSKLVPFKGVFAKLKDPHYFKTVSIDKESGTICWDNGADLSPCVLYSKVRK